MEVKPVPRVHGVLLFVPAPHVDERGFFSRTFDAEVVRSRISISPEPTHRADDNQSCSHASIGSMGAERPAGPIPSSTYQKSDS